MSSPRDTENVAPSVAPPDSREKEWAVKFIVGVIVGFGIGVASSIVYSGQTGKDLREVYGDVRKNVESVDLEQFGQEVQSNVAQAQAQVQAGVTQAQEKVAEVRGKSGGNGTATDEPIPETTTE
jgi:gas vesicle protein